MTIAPTALKLDGVTDATTKEEVREQALAAAHAASAKKGEGTTVLDVGDILSIADFFVITSGTNERQVKAIVEEVEEQLKMGAGLSPLRVEGATESRWVLMDYGDFWVHVFHDETRRYYDLERLWADAPQVPFEDTPSGDAAAGSE